MVKVTLSWFGKAEKALTVSNSVEAVETWLESAEINWQTVKENRILFDEPLNDGSWIRNWRQSLNEYSRRLEEM